MMHLVSQLGSRLHSVLQDDVALKVADSVANKTTITGGGITLFGGITVNEWAMLIGAILGIAGFAAELWFKHRRLHLDREYQEQKIKLLKEQIACGKVKHDQDNDD